MTGIVSNTRGLSAANLTNSGHARFFRAGFFRGSAMRKITLMALAVSTVIATPAAAQSTTGTVNLAGTVGDKCIVVSETAGTTFGTTVNFGELSQADGTMRTDLASSFTSLGGSALAARVVCTTANPTIAISATPLAISGAGTPDTGYDNSIDYTAHVAVTTVTTPNVPFSATTTTPLTATAIGGRLANNGSSNVVISADSFATNSATDLLVAGAYTGQIQVVIAPGA